MIAIGQKVRQEFATQIMTVISTEPEFIENIVTQWEDKTGDLITAKFMEAQLEVVND